MVQYKIKAPVGTIVTPKDIMTEQELRAFMIQLVQDSEQHETWKEKATKDSIEDIVDWMTRAGFIIEKIES